MTDSAPGVAGKTSLDTDEIRSLLPHRPPILLVDQVTEVEPGSRAKGFKHLHPDDPVFLGHFPAEPIMPGVLIVEACGQLGALALAMGDAAEQGALAAAGKPTGLLASINRFKFLDVVRPGDRLEMSVEVGKRIGDLLQLLCEARVGRKLVAKGELSVALVK